jgi:REP element-mobilizing transposase RayT
MSRFGHLVKNENTGYRRRMPRRARFEAAGAIHHVVPQGNAGARIVRDDADRQRLVDRIATVAAERGWVLLAWSVLDTHAHVVVCTLEPNLGQGMKQILGGFSRYFHLRHGGYGALFVPRFWSKPVVDERQLLRTVLYVDLNPVAAGLVDHPSRYPWGSFGRRNRLALDCLGATADAADAAYRELVDEACASLLGNRPCLPETVASIVSSTFPAHARVAGGGRVPTSSG